jgi:hypothetical protein
MSRDGLSVADREGDPEPDVRLENPTKLDNMLINKIGYGKPALTLEGRECR